MRLVLSSALLLAPFVGAQDPAADVALATLREDSTAAARAIANVSSPAARARLQAAMLPPPQRAGAMLAVARAFPQDAEADRAILAGAAALMVAMQRNDAVPEVDAWEQALDRREFFDHDAMASMVLGFRDAAVERAKKGGDVATLREAERLLAFAFVSRHGLGPARVPVDAQWERPADLAEPLQLRAFPCGPGRLPWDRLDRLGGPAWTATLPVSGEVELPPLLRGNWLIEARSETSPWRGVRVAEVSDLDVIALAHDGHLVVGAFDANGPIAATWRLSLNGREVQHGEIGASPAVVAVPSAAAEYEAYELQVAGVPGSAWLWSADLRRQDFVGASWLAHTMVDGPLYRPGETVQGRVVLRSCVWTGTRSSQIPDTAPAVDRPFDLVVEFEGGRLALPLRTDARGVAAFEFVVPPEARPGAAFSFAVEPPPPSDGGQSRALTAERLCRVLSFRRRAVALRIDAPKHVDSRTPLVEVVATAEWASGGPKAGLDVRAKVRSWGGEEEEREESLQLRTDADGRATLRVPVEHVKARWIRAELAVIGPDGVVVTAAHGLEIVDDSVKEQPDDEERGSAPKITLGAAVVGSPCGVTLRGLPHQHGLLVVGRGVNARPQAVRLDERGDLTIDVPVLRADWPTLNVGFASTAGSRSESVSVELRAMRAPTIEVPEHAAPGTDVAVRVHTDAPGAVVTVAVVDERVFELAFDRTRNPSESLRPAVADWRWGQFAGAPKVTLGQFLGQLLEDGRLPPTDGHGEVDWGGRSSAGGAGGRVNDGGGGVRDRFSPTAVFTTVIADGDGNAPATFRMPSDLTRWRVTAVVIAPDGTGAIARQSFASRQPIAAEPVVPRALRQGDTFEMPVAVDRSAEAVAPTDVASLTVATEGTVLQVDRAATQVTVPVGRTVATTVPLRAVAAGDASLSLGVELGEHMDRSVRSMAVGPDAVVRPLAAAALGTGVVTVHMPDGTSPDRGIVVDVLQGGAAAWQRLEQELAAYPYGCAEQTLARLVPFFAMARAAKARGQALPAIDAAFGVRLRSGLERLRNLQVSSSLFAFWPGGKAEPGISALVQHGLAVLRDGGFDLARSALRTDAPWGVDRLVAADGSVVVDAAYVTNAELLAAGLRLHPDSGVHSLVVPALDVLPQLPAGLCARLGLALHAAGDVRAARRCYERVAAASAPPLGADGFPGEDPLAVQALQLELGIALKEPLAATDRAAADLMLACLRGGASTYAHACALSALALALPPASPVAANVVVECGGERRELALGGKDRASVQCRLPRGNDVTVRGPDGMQLLVRVATERAERASDHAPWASPIRVERDWCVEREGAAAEDRQLEPLTSSLQVGRSLVLRLRVTSPIPMRHVVVGCPLPAGFEVSGARRGVERFDDRVAFACDLVAGSTTELRVDVVPMASGRFVWPPATAAPMYVTGHEGGTAGAFVEVVPVSPDAVPSSATCFTGPPPVRPVEVPDPFALFRASVREDWEAGGQPPRDEAARHGAIEETLRHAPPAEASPWRQLDALTDLVDDLSEPEPRRLPRVAAWRVGVFERVRGMLCECTLAAFAAPITNGAEDANEREALRRAVGQWPRGEARDQLVARLLELARGTNAAEARQVLWLVNTPVEDATLVAALRGCLGDSDAEVRLAAFRALPLAERQNLPPVLVLGAQNGACDEGVIGMLASTPVGRAELRVRLAEPTFVVLQRGPLSAELPAEMWREVPLRSFAALAAVAGDLGAVAERVAAAPFTTDQLCAAMAAARVPECRFVIANALRLRRANADGVAAPAEDPLWPAWCRALHLAPDVASIAEANALLDVVRAHLEGDRFSGEGEQLARFVTPTLVAAGNPQQLYAAAPLLETEDWGAAWRRFASADRVALVDMLRHYVGASFVADTADEAEAIWRCLLRSGDVDGAVETLTRSDAGIDCIRAHLTAGDGGEHAQTARVMFADALGLDPSTLSPREGLEARSLLLRVRRCGFGTAKTEAERAAVQRIRRLCGLGAAGG